MPRSRTESWSTARSLAFLAAVFAITLGSLLPFGVMAAAQPGHPIVLCSAEGPQVIQVGGDMDGPGGKAHPAKCAACVMPLLAAMPAAPAVEPAAATVRLDRAVEYGPTAVCPPPPARAPPRPPSTAPPLA